MTQHWETIDSVDTGEGKLELMRASNDDWAILIDRRTLMSSRFHRSEIALAELACRPLADRERPRVLVSGLGMGYTLRAALDVLPPQAEVVVAELNPVVVDWCRGPLAELCSRVLDDSRVRIEVDDVRVPIGRAADGGEADRYDALVLDLYEGPYAVPRGQEDPLFGRRALARMREALRSAGCLAVWSEQPERSFEGRLRRAGFDVECHRPHYKGPRHVVYLARPGARRRR